MALLTVKRRFELERVCVLAPERYDPRRESLRSGSLSKTALPLGSVAQVVRQTINPALLAAVERRYVVLDTSDAREGLIVGRKNSICLEDLGSTKKQFARNDVLISRLRPYLRQVAYVDEGFAVANPNVEFACSTEFFVLRSLTDEAIAFLVPYLLSKSVQRVLAASQEGGHHPRFDETALASLPIPDTLLASREKVSEEVMKSAVLYRQSEQIMMGLVSGAEASISK